MKVLVVTKRGIGKHLGHLDRGPSEWNLWREGEPDAIPDLRAADLVKEFLGHANFQNSILRSANLSQANLSHADLSSLRIYGGRT
jgi:hypothetical protein